jgi:hypothetical protein
MESLRELFLKLGLEADEAAFATAQTAVFGITTAAELAVKAVQALGEAMFESLKSAIEYGGQMADTSASTGAAADALQRMAFAAGMGGASFEDVAGALSLLTRKMAEAKDGTKEAVEGFAKLHVKVTDASGRLRSADEVMGDIAESLSKMDPGERLPAAFDVLGRGAKSMLPALAAGREELQKLLDEADELGVVLGDEDIGALDDLGDALDKLGRVATSIRNEVGAELAGAIQPTITAMLEWWKANGAIVKQDLRTFIRGLGKVLSALGATVGAVVKHIDKLVLVLKLAAVALASHFLASTIIASGGLLQLLINTTMNTFALGLYTWAVIKAGVATATAWIGAAAPVLLLTALIATLLLIAQDVWGFFNGYDSVLGTFGPKWTKFLDSWTSSNDGDGWLLSSLKAVVAALSDLEKSVPAAVAFWKGVFREFFDWLGQEWANSPVLRAAISVASAVVPGAGLAGTAAAAFGAASASPGGTAASQAGSSSTTVVSPRFEGVFNVTAAPGQSAKEVAGEVRTQMDDWFRAQWQGATYGTGG